MKRIYCCMLALAGMVSTGVQAQEANDAFIKIEEHNMFSQCFAPCDTNGDGVVTYGEAATATMLSLDRGGRLNIIEDYGFLKHFPNLTALALGNTTVEVVDLHHLTKLKLVDVTHALWLKKIIVGGDMAPEITGESHDDPMREAIKVEFYVDDPVVRSLFDEGYNYVEPVRQDGDTYYVVSKETGVYGLWHNGKLEVPCSYNYDVLKQNYFTVSMSEITGSNIVFADEAFKAFCLFHKLDVNGDKEMSIDEAKAQTRLSLMNFKSLMRTVKTYEDLQYFPNLEYFHAGMSYVDTLDVSCCPKLKELDASDCRKLQVIVLAKGCKPEIKYPVAWKGENPKLVYAKKR